MEAIPGAAVLFCFGLGWHERQVWSGVRWRYDAGARWQAECGSPRQCRTADGDGCRQTVARWQAECGCDDRYDAVMRQV